MSGIGTAMESMGCCPYKNLELILPWLDTYLMDIKHTDPEKHKAFTGVRNELMLENARKVAVSGMTELVVRVPVIPTFNDTKKEIQDIAVFAGQLPGVRRIHLLPSRSYFLHLFLYLCFTGTHRIDCFLNQVI